MRRFPPRVAFSQPLSSLPHRQSLRPPPLPVRYASTSQSATRRFFSTALLIGGTVALVTYYYDSRSLLHEHVVMPVARLFDPETGHRLAVRLLSGPRWLRPWDRGVDGPELKAELFGLPIVNPIGIAAGFDKDGQAIDGLFDLGFGYVEIGSVTPEPQPGNPKPRFFRLPGDEAAINRYGFNSLGHGQTLGRLRARLVAYSKSNPTEYASPSTSNPFPPQDLPRSLRPGHILAVNLGKNKTSPADSNEDYVKGVRMLGPYADVVVINVSSPNTPGLRALQGRKVLEGLLKEVVEERDKIKGKDGLPKIAVKVACDLSEDELGDVAAAVRQSGIDGVIVSNTTVKREGLGLLSPNQSEIGGLSGKPLFPLALSAVCTIRPLLPPSTPLIACGGISTAEDALLMARAGASTFQIYTSFGYRGVGTPRLLKDDLASMLRLEGRTWKDEVGRQAGEDMGWDEKRLERESERLKAEAERWGEELRKMQEDEDTRRLVEEAQAALGRGPDEASQSEGTGSRAAPPESTRAGSSIGMEERAGLDAPDRRRGTLEPPPLTGVVESGRPVLIMLEDMVTPDGDEIVTTETMVEVDPSRETSRVSDGHEPAEEEREGWRTDVTSGDRRLV